MVESLSIGGLALLELGNPGSEAREKLGKGEAVSLADGVEYFVVLIIVVR